MTNVTLIAGGVGGAKMAEGLTCVKKLSSALSEMLRMTNFTDYGYRLILILSFTLCPSKINQSQELGVNDEGHRALDVLKELGKETWMFLGDRDFGLHIYRTERLKNGDRPSDITSEISQKFGITSKINLPTDDKVQTRVRTTEGWQTFQEYFVRDKCVPDVLELHYEGLSQSSITPEAESSIVNAELIVLAPSNPLVSISPIIEIPGFKKVLQNTNVPIIAVSPLINGKVIKGPADKMLASLGHRPDVLGIAQYYKDVISHLVIDELDSSFFEDINSIGISPYNTDILMRDAMDKKRLALKILEILYLGGKSVSTLITFQ